MDRPPIAAALEVLRPARRISVLTGAGISTDSGIPDFRGPNGVWTKDPAAEKQFTLQNYMADPQLRKIAWRNRAEHPAWTARPSKGHEALVELERAGRLELLITQNIDGLHQAAGTSPDKLVEIHGSLREVVCMSCGARDPMQVALDRVREGEEDPPCTRCGGILKSATISFGQSLVQEDLDRARQAAEDCDAFIAIGTSLTVAPVSQLPWIARQGGAPVVIVNAEPTPFDGYAACALKEPIGKVLPVLVGGLTQAT